MNMNKKKSIYAAYEEIKQREINELKKKLRDFGGVAHFGPDYTGEGATGVDCPIVLCNFGCGPADMLVHAVSLTDDDCISILAYDQEAGQEIDMNLDDIAYGHISFITDLVPDVDIEHKEKKERLVMETAIFMAWDMFTQMYFPKKGWGLFEVCHEIINLAKEFEHTRTWSVDDEDYDEGRYFDELIKFENKYLDEFKKKL